MSELRQIHLHGILRTLYKDELYLAVDSVGECIRALSYQIPGFKETLKNGEYKVYFDKEENSIPAEVVPFGLGGIKDIHIQPVLAGDKGSGAGKVLAGVALIGLSFATMGAGAGLAGALGAGNTAGIITNATAGVITAGGATVGGTVLGLSSAFIGKIGISLALSGVSQLLAPEVASPSGSASFERAESRPSFLFNGPVNTVEEGGPVPLVYGRVRVGSTVVSTGLRTENI